MVQVSDGRGVRIERWLDIVEQDAMVPQIDEIFFGSSATRDFSDDVARAAFRERWLGGYLEHDAQWFYVALGADADSGALCVAGYLAACVDDPRGVERFSDIGYFEVFRDLLDAYPAHLHINLHEDFRGAGIGGQLIARFAEDASRAGAIGVHVVTGQESRAVNFYYRCGFQEKGCTQWNGVDNVFLGRTLNAG